MSKRPKHLRPEEVREEWREYFFYDRQEVQDSHQHRRLVIRAKCPECYMRHWVLASDVRRGRRSPYCPLHKWVAGGLQRRRPLQPEEVGPDWYPYLDFTKQKSRNNNLHIWVICPDCQYGRWVPTNHIRNKHQKSPHCLVCKSTGANSPLWLGGRHLRHGYAWVLVSTLAPAEQELFGAMADSRGYISEHRLVLARHLGRLLRSDEIVHHLNGVKDDNRLENLKLLTQNTHHTGHGDNYYQQLQEALTEIKRLKEQLRTIQAG